MKRARLTDVTRETFEKTLAAQQQPAPQQPRQPIGHVLKCWPQQFEDVRIGAKIFEIRKDDRDFAPGDTVVFVEYDPATEQHTGRSETRVIGYLGRGAPYPPGVCAFQLTYGEAIAATAPMGRLR